MLKTPPRVTPTKRARLWIQSQTGASAQRTMPMKACHRLRSSKQIRIQPLRARQLPRPQLVAHSRQPSIRIRRVWSTTASVSDSTCKVAMAIISWRSSSTVIRMGMRPRRACLMVSFYFWFRFKSEFIVSYYYLFVFKFFDKFQWSFYGVCRNFFIRYNYSFQKVSNNQVFCCWEFYKAWVKFAMKKIWMK